MPPYSGSTMIKELLASSKYVSTFRGGRRGEGQTLPGASEILFKQNRWNPDLEVNWDLVKEIFYKNWDFDKPVLFEKSPPHLIRALQIEKVFSPSYFLIGIRNPYAHIEGLIRRNNSSPTAGAEFWLKCAKFQIINLKHLKNTCYFRYEDLTDDTEKTIEKIRSFIPEIRHLNKDKTFIAHNITNKPIKGIVNLNNQKISLLKQKVIDEISRTLRKEKEVVDYFNYEIID